MYNSINALPLEPFVLPHRRGMRCKADFDVPMLLPVLTS